MENRVSRSGVIEQTANVWAVQRPLNSMNTATTLPSVSSGVDPRALRAARERAGMTQHELARLVGVAGGERISRWELGASEPRPDLLAKLAEVLHIRPRQLVRFDGEAPDLRALRLTAGLLASEVARAAHLSPPTYMRWEEGRGERLPATTTISALARALNVAADDVVEAFNEARKTYRSREQSER